MIEDKTGCERISVATMERKVAVITGAASGIGLATAKRFVQDGFLVAVCDVDDRIGNLFTAETEQGTALVHVGDLTDETVRESLISSVADSFGRLDVLVNNAASGGPAATVADVSLAALRQTLEINVVAVFRLIQLALPLLKMSGWGKIINLGSLFADQPAPNGAAYSVTKGAIHTLTKVLAVELGEYGVVSNTVAPGYILTPMHLDEIAHQANAMGITVDERTQQLREEVPILRHGTPEDVASVIAWLAGRDSGYVNGHTVAVNGGLRFT